MTITLTENPPLLLHLQRREGDPLAELIEEVRRAGLSCALEAGTERRAIRLALLLNDILYPALEAEEEAAKQDLLLSFEERARGLLEKELGGEEAVDPFLERCRSLAEEEELFRKLFKEAAAGLEREVKQKSALLKERLQLLSSSRKEGAEALHHKLDGLTERIDSLIEKIRKEALSAEAIGREAAEQATRLQELLSESEKLLKTL